MDRPKILLTCWLLFLCLYLSASGNPYFTQLFAQINENIEAGDYERNIEAQASFTQERAFQVLSCYEKGKVFHKIGVSYYLLDREEEAIQCFQDSVLTSWENCQEVPPSERATTIYNIGICYQYLGDTDHAKQYLDDALLIFENDTNYPAFKLASKFQGIANFYQENYDSFRAKLYYENALNIFRDIDGTELLQFDILNNFLIMSVDFKQYEEANTYFKEAMLLYKQFPEAIDDYDLSILYQNAGIAHFELGEMEEAMARSQSALNLIDSTEYPILYSNAIEKVAMINGENGHYAESIKLLHKVARLRSKYLSNKESYQYLAYAYENLCDIYQRQGDLKRAGEFYQKTLEALMIKGAYDKDGIPIISQSLAIDDLDLVRVLSFKTQLHQKEFEDTRNQDFLEKSLVLHTKIDTLISQHLLSLQFQGSKLNFIALIQTYYGAAIEDALRLHGLTGDQKYLRLAYFFSSKTKAIILQNELNRANAFQSIASPEMIKKEKRLVQEMYDIQEQLTKEQTNQDSLLRAYVEAQRELDRFLLNIEEEEPDYYQNKYAFIRPPNLETVQASLPKDVALVEYFYQADIIFSFWITRNDLIQIAIDNDPKLEQSIRSFVKQCHDPGLSLSNSVSHLLYQKLIKQGLDRVDEKINRLCLIPDGVLHTIPFETLNTSGPEEQQFLIEDYSVTYSYSIGLLFREKDRSFAIPYLGFGAKYSPDLSRKLKNKRRLFGEENLSQLALSEEEINRANNIFSGKSFLGQNATLENFYKYSNNARLIHLSLHGLVDFEDPLRSSILFDDHQEDFILSAADLYSHKINADLVILSACHSADGKIYLGEGVQGMSKAFILSGAKTILSSLWSASEASSLPIMTSFLAKVEEKTPNDLALHQAKLDYLANARPSQRHPFYWANFIIIGELNSNKMQSFPLGKSALVALLVIALFLFIRKNIRTHLEIRS